MARSTTSGGRRPPLVPARRGRPDPAPLHAGPRPRRGRRQGRPEDEIAVRRAARAVLARRARAPPGARRARDRDRRLARPLARPRPHRALPAPGGHDRARGDAPALHRAGGEREGVHRADALPRRARRPARRARLARRARPASCSRSSSSCSGSPATCRTSRRASSAARRSRSSRSVPRRAAGPAPACDHGEIALSPEGVHGIARAAPLADRGRGRRRASASAPQRDALRSSRRRTSTTAASACGRCPPDGGSAQRSSNGSGVAPCTTSRRPRSARAA